jgi:hypothetical protein
VTEGSVAGDNNGADVSRICGTDLHILHGDVPTCKPGRILGHEGDRALSLGVNEEQTDLRQVSASWRMPDPP